MFNLDRKVGIMFVIFFLVTVKQKTPGLSSDKEPFKI